MVKPPPDIRARLVRIGALADGRIDPAETALVLASVERPGVSMAPYRRHLERLAAEAAAYADSADGPGGLGLRVETLAQVIARRYGYGGAEDAYDDPDTANLKRGIGPRPRPPVAPGLIHSHAARARLSGGYNLCVASDALVSPGRVLRRVLAHHGLEGYFSGFVFSDEIDCSKPDPRMFHEAADQLGIALESMVHIGDRDHNDIKGPQALGMKAVLFTAVRDNDKNNTSADAICTDHADLPAIIERLDRGE